MRIAMLEPLGVSKELIESLAAPIRAAGHTVDTCYAPYSPEEKAAAAKDADYFIIANSPLSGDIIRSAETLKGISVGFAGVDHVDAAAVAERDIALDNAAGYCTDAVAELTMGLILNVLRNMKPCDAATRAGGTRAGLMGHELAGKTIGIVGTGHIGCRVAELAKAFRCKVLAYSRTEKQAVKDMGGVYCDLDTLLKESDIVTLHTPLTADTKLLISVEKLALMKESAVLINCARGAVVDNAALAEALRAGKLAGAGIDVFETEPPIAADHPLMDAPNAVLAPHVAFATFESLDRRAQIAFGNVYRWLGIEA